MEIPTLEHFDYTGKSLGFLNEAQSKKLRRQIFEKRINGCYIICEDRKFDIAFNGSIIEWGGGYFLTNEEFVRHHLAMPRIIK